MVFFFFSIYKRECSWLCRCFGWIYNPIRWNQKLRLLHKDLVYVLSLKWRLWWDFKRSASLLLPREKYMKQLLIVWESWILCCKIPRLEFLLLPHVLKGFSIFYTLQLCEAYNTQFEDEFQSLFFLVFNILFVICFVQKIIFNFLSLLMFYLMH